MPKFNITAVGSGESKPANEMRWVNLGQLEDDPMNEEIYNTDGIEELAADIELNGLMQYPLVRFMPGGMYRIISGHRRVKAIRLLAKKDKTQWKTIPVILDSDKDETSIAIKLISANAVNRHMTRREQYLQALKLYELLTEQKEKENLPGRVRDMVAKKLNISSGSVGAYLQMSNNLIALLLEYYLDGSLSKSAAIEMSKLPEEKQEQLLDKIESELILPDMITPEFIKREFPEEYITHKSENPCESSEAESENASESVSHSDTQEQEEMPKTWTPTSGWVKLPEERRLKIMQMMKEGGATNIEPCEQCHTSTECVGCCKICITTCNARQGCHREQGNIRQEQEKSVSERDTQKDENVHTDTTPKYWNSISGYVKDNLHHPRYHFECEECYKATGYCQGCCARCKNHCHFYQQCAKEKKKQDLRDKYENDEIVITSAINSLIGYSVGIKESCKNIREIAGGSCPPECPLCVEGMCNLPDNYPHSYFLREARRNNKELDYMMKRAGV